MKITAIGVGGALGEGLNTNFLIDPNDVYKNKCEPAVSEGKLLAFDCGQTFPEGLRRAGIDFRDVGGVFVSHLHADHAGGLEWLGFSSYFKTMFPFGQHRPRLFGMWEVIHNLWDHTLRGGMESIQNQRNVLETYFHPCPTPPNGSFKWCGTTFEIVQTIHVVDDRRIVPSAGVRFHTGSNMVFITGDTQYAPNQIMSYYKDADVIFQDCEIATYPGSVHAQLRELAELPEEIKAKMWLVHYDGDLEHEYVKGLNKGFRGFVKEGQVFDL